MTPQQRRAQVKRMAFARAVKAIKRWERPRQLSLDAYLHGYEAGEKRWLRNATKALDEPFTIWNEARVTGVMQSRGRTARAEAERTAFLAGCPSWGRLRDLVYARDKGICWVCDERVPWEQYELGHLKERLTGGTDTPDNVVVMCYRCNRARKPIHETRAEAEAWRDSRAWVFEEARLIDTAIKQTAESYGITEDELWQRMLQPSQPGNQSRSSESMNQTRTVA